MKYLECHLLPYFHHLHYTDVAYAHELIVYPLFDVILFYIVAVIVFAVMSASFHVRELRRSPLGKVTHGKIIQHCIPNTRPA